MKKIEFLLVALLALILAVTASLLLGCGHHHGGGGTGFQPPFPGPPLAAPYQAKQVATVPEHITDMLQVGNVVFLSPYLSYSSGKIYRLDSTGLHAESLNCGRVESVYRIWQANGAIFAGTEQPPRYLQRPWRTIQKYSSHGWAVLGNVASDGTVWRGWSYRGKGSKLWRNDAPFPGIPGRIVWWVESYAGKYYAGTSGDTSYKNANDGRIYVWENAWKPVPTGPMGGVITLKTFKGALYAGTCHPQSIWRFNGTTWQKWDFNGTEEVSKFWTDEAGRLFTATTEGGKIRLRQWDGNTWPEVWSIPGRSKKWGPQGCARNGAITLVFWSGNTRIWKILYR